MVSGGSGALPGGSGGSPVSGLFGLWVPLGPGPVAVVQVSGWGVGPWRWWPWRWDQKVSPVGAVHQNH